jgi:hypothetical protein
MFLSAANAMTTDINIFLTNHGISILSDVPTIVLNEMIKRSKVPQPIYQKNMFFSAPNATMTHINIFSTSHGISILSECQQ